MPSSLNLLDYIVVFSPTIPLLIGVVRRHPLKSFLIYLGFYLEESIRGLLNIFFWHANNMWSDNLFTLFEFIYLVHLLLSWISPKHARPKFYALTLLWVVSWIFFMAQKGSLYLYNSPAHLLQSFLIISLSAYHLYKLSLESSSILKEATFWISSGLFISNNLFIAYFIIAEKVRVLGGASLIKFDIIYNSGIIISLIMFSIGLLCNWKESKSSLASSR